MPENFKTPINISETEKEPQASLRKKRKRPDTLTINIPTKKIKKPENFILPPTPQVICPTPELEKYINREGNNHLSPHYDARGNTFFKFESGAIFVFGKNTLVAGAQGKVCPGGVITPGYTRCYPLVKKTGGATTKREVEILEAIKENRNTGFPFHLIQKIQGWQTEGTDTSHYSRHEEGGDLQQHQVYIQEQCKRKNDMARSYVFKLVSELAEGLDALHNSRFADIEKKLHSGIVHNDLKPANIFVRANGDVVIADFGCAYFADEAAFQYSTLCFTAPELFLDSTAFCRVPSKNAAKSDMFSLGLTLTLLLKGKLPEKRNREGYVIPSQLPDVLETQLQFRSWAEVYENSIQCKKAREAKKYLQELETSAFSGTNPTIQEAILMNLALVMQLPVAERPTSKELKELTHNLACYFGSPELRAEKSRIFASTLIENRENKAKEAADHENGLAKRLSR